MNNTDSYVSSRSEYVITHGLSQHSAKVLYYYIITLLFQITTTQNVPIHKGSEMKATLLFGPTSMHNLPNLTTGQDFLHSCLHFLGLHRSELIMAIRV